MLAYCESNRPDKARGLVQKTKMLSQAVGGWYAKLYMVWLLGTLARVEGRYKEAEAIFEDVRNEFRRRGHLAWYLEASLDLARAYLEESNFQSLEDLAGELLEELGEQGDWRVSAAVVCFAKAVRARTLSGQLLRTLVIAVGSGWMLKKQP